MQGFLAAALVVFPLVLASLPVAVLAQEPSYSASPSGQVQNYAVACENLSVTSGDGAFAPQLVVFETELSGDENAVDALIYHFGDGNTEEGLKKEDHRYLNAGDYTVYVEIRDTEGHLIQNDACRTQVSLRKPILAQNRIGCGELEIDFVNSTQVPAETNMRVDGFETADGLIRQYVVEIEDGDNWEQESPDFSYTFDKPGTYTVKAYVKNEDGDRYGGEGLCEQVVTVGSTTMERQPDTGVSLTVVAGLAALGLVGLGMWQVAVRWS